MNSKPGPAALISPSAARNRDPILAVLRRELPGRGTVVEVASGSGEHAVYMAAALAGILWQPTDRDPEALASIAAHREAAGLANLLPPLRLDAAAPSWPVETADAIVAVNMIHIAPWRAAEGLMAGAGRILPAAGALILYGPFAEAGRELAPSNVAFDESLRLRNPEWGLREIGQVGAEAARHGLTLAARHEMPANNLTLVFRRPAGG
ncbi:DUF938 domain-containing protein [Enterovirga sp.]|uniref:DUF938 domain-containing protein n=1 Tax=Enterovirga sp. TaxID=2026350 RepID=UPI0026082619|nr:DUF938 domain-containing protein [Enterovirga sp.]MDB5592720.1 hypothetical protein [Enterovirga sp.]